MTEAQTCVQLRSGVVCGAPDAKPYLIGLACPEHTPAAREGRPEPYVDPELTLEALQRKAGRRYQYMPTDSRVVDEKAVKTGKRGVGRKSYHRTRRAAYAERMKREGLTD